MRTMRPEPDEEEEDLLRPVADIVDGIVARIGGGRRPALLAVREAWVDIAGARWVEVCHPVQLRDGILVVEVPDGASASLLRYDLGNLERRLRALVPNSGARNMRVRVKGPSVG